MISVKAVIFSYLYLLIVLLNGYTLYYIVSELVFTELN